MLAQSKQKRAAIAGLDEAGSPFKHSRTQRIFKDSANLQLRGNTYDANHLEKFFNSGFGDKTLTLSHYAEMSKIRKSGAETSSLMSSQMSVQYARDGHRNVPSYITNSQSIKPSVSFMNLKREDHVFNAYVDLKSSPSTLQKRPEIPTVVERNAGPSMYETERLDHAAKAKQKMARLSSVRDKLYAKPEENSSILTTPKEKRDEIYRIKQEMEEYRDFKKQQMFLGRRERVMKGAWRHGVLGIDDADSHKTQVFYEQARDNSLAEQNEKNSINNYRTKIVSLGMGTSNQMDVGGEDLKRNSTLHKKGLPDKVVEIQDHWKSKRAIPDARKNSQQRIFEPASNVNRQKEEGCMNKIKIERSIKLRDEEIRGRKYNILTGASDKETWKSSFGDQQRMGSQSPSGPVTTNEDMKAHWRTALAEK